MSTLVSISELVVRAHIGLSTGDERLYSLRLLPIFEHPWKAAVLEFQNSIVSNFGEHIHPDVLLEKLICSTLISESGYWVSSALAWIEDGYPVSALVGAALESCSSRKGLPQAVRHRACKLKKLGL